jgi:hypothetical protein
MAQDWNNQNLSWQDRNLPWKNPALPWNNSALPWKTGSASVVVGDPPPMQFDDELNSQLLAVLDDF